MSWCARFESRQLRDLKPISNQQTRVYPYPLVAGSARPNPKMGAPDPESPLYFLGFLCSEGVRDHGVGVDPETVIKREKQESLNSDSNGFWPCDSNRAILNRCEPMAIRIAANREPRFETSKVEYSGNGQKGSQANTFWQYLLHKVSRRVRDRKCTPKKLCDKDFCRTFGWTFWYDLPQNPCSIG